MVAVIFFLKYKKKKGGSSKKAADYTYSPAGGGDELDNLIPNKQSFVFRNHFNHTRFIIQFIVFTHHKVALFNEPSNEKQNGLVLVLSFFGSSFCGFVQGKES